MDRDGGDDDDEEFKKTTFLMDNVVTQAFTV